VGDECWNIFCIARGEVVDAENGPVERECANEHHRVAGGDASRRSVDTKLEGIYNFADGERQASTEGGGNLITGANRGRGPR